MNRHPLEKLKLALTGFAIVVGICVATVVGLFILGLISSLIRGTL